MGQARSKKSSVDQRMKTYQIQHYMLIWKQCLQNAQCCLANPASTQLWHPPKSRPPALVIMTLAPSLLTKRVVVVVVKCVLGPHPKKCSDIEARKLRSLLLSSSRLSFSLPSFSSQHPLAPPLDEFIQHEPNVREDEAADVEREELRSVACTQLQSDVRLRRMLEAWIFDLARDLICRARQN